MKIPKTETIDADRAFVQRVLNGDTDAIRELLIDRLGKRIQFISDRLKLGDQRAALFLFLAAKEWKPLRDWKGECTLDSWLNTICGHFLSRLAEKEGLKEKKLVSRLVGQDGLKIAEKEGVQRKKPVVESLTDSQEVGSHYDDPLEKFIREETRGQLLDAIRSLPNKEYRLVLTLRNIEEITVTETAKIMGMSVARLSLLHHRAKQALKRHLEDGGSYDV